MMFDQIIFYNIKGKLKAFLILIGLRDKKLALGDLESFIEYFIRSLFAIY
jgi:hypothetical protein